ncbi:hypothetical protein TSUD_87860 [Trifolium subterraneum]|uniref:Reverse transcriptase Ty1/copia-type domain-containing protein n=1 Tax=Trifolium subterraneum TaxID=3900 RepID=A0A2Z6PEG6_TRISU|nr:hypothetical protein TSUD_87860 [Trifolium subterraneum]
MASSNLFAANGNFSTSHAKIANLISVKLDDNNYKQWKQQVSGVIRGFDLQPYVTDPAVPAQFLSDEARDAGTVNPLYQSWQKQDALVCTWLLSTILESLLANSLSHIQQLISKLNAEFALKQLGALDYFLGIEVSYLSSGGLLLSQAKYIRDLLARATMENANAMPTPMASTLKLSKVGSTPVENPTLFRSIVGALQYATLTRPEISYSVNKVCQFLSNPLEEHWKAVKRILRYLSGTLTYGLVLQPAPIHQPLSLIRFCDANWASDPDDRRSTSGACIYVGPNLVSWWSKKQTLVARSSAEAEYRSLASLTAEILWLQSLLTELQCKFSTPRILCDNLSTVSLAHNPTLHHRTKHMELDIFFVREKVLSKHLSVSHVPAQDQWADILTKPLSAVKFGLLRGKLRVFNKQDLSKPASTSKGEC